MQHNLNLKLLECLQCAGEEITKEYKVEANNKNYIFEVIQFSDISLPDTSGKQDIVRQTADLYDQYKGNEDYIHIPNVAQMCSNFRRFPVVGVINQDTRELEGVVTIKFNDNSEKMDPYYPKENAKFFSITGIIVRQREGILNKGLGTGLYETAVLGIQRYVEQHPKDPIELNIVIDCTNLPSLYSLSKAIKNINSHQLLGKNKKINSNLEGVYIVRDENGHLVESPTYVLKVDLPAKETVKQEREEEKEKIISFHVTEKNEKHEKYKELLNEILDQIKVNKSCKVVKMQDGEAGEVSYINTSNLGISLTNMKSITNGAEQIGERRTPREDSNQFIGPMPNVHINRINVEEER